MRYLVDAVKGLMARPAGRRFVHVAELLLYDAALAMLCMALIAVVSGVAHLLHVDQHEIYSGYTIGHIFRFAHVANILATLGFGLYHLIKALRD